jgi:hypothetical protein
LNKTLSMSCSLSAVILTDQELARCGLRPAYHLVWLKPHQVIVPRTGLPMPLNECYEHALFIYYFNCAIGNELYVVQR